MPNHSSLGRREFFGSAASAAVSLTASSYANVLGSQERIRVAFLGCGGRAQAHIDLVNRFAREKRGVVPVAVCDVWHGLDDHYDISFGGKITRRHYSQGLFPSALKCGLDTADRLRVSKDYRLTLDLPDVDVVCIATPDHWHAKMTIDALAAGKDVYVERPLARTIEEATAVVDAWTRSRRVVAVGAQTMADPIWVKAFEMIRSGKIGPITHAQTGCFRNDIRGQWRYYRLAPSMTPKTIDWDMFLGHRFEINGRPIGPTSQEQPFDRGAFAQWRCLREFSGGPLTDMLAPYITHMIAAMGVGYPGRVTAAGGLFLERDGRTVPDVVTVVADFPEGCQLVATAATTSSYPLDEVIRGRRGAIQFGRGELQLFRDDPTRGPIISSRSSRTAEPSEVISVEPPRNETESHWENFLECIRSRRNETFCPPDLAAISVAITSLAERSFQTGSAPLFWDAERKIVCESVPNWASREYPRETSDSLSAPDYQKLAGQWVNGKEPAR